MYLIRVSFMCENCEALNDCTRCNVSIRELVKLCQLREEKHSAANFDLRVIPQMFAQRKSCSGSQ